MYAVEVHNVSKTYRLYDHPVDRLKEALLRRPFHRPFQPLREVSFVVPHGGILGIIGDNGAGKSTLLKILAGTLTPSSGQVIHRGRVAALLELGAGFHAEFSGRQNIYLNASLLGLSDAEIRAREAGIIEFSELGEFIDRPVKTYSSGMYVRLAFSIATSVDPDILIIDEALSVGDAHFQKKCVDRMMQFREQGKTMLFCTHSMYQIQELCDQALWLDHGSLRMLGATTEVINAYTAHLENRRYQPRENLEHVPPSALPEVLIEKIEVLDKTGQTPEQWQQFEPLTIRVHTRRAGDTPRPGHLGVGIIRPDEQIVFAASTKHDGLAPVLFNGRQVTAFSIPSLPLNSGIYRVKALVGDEHLLHFFNHYVAPGSFIISSQHPKLGEVWMAHEWQLPKPGNAPQTAPDNPG